MAAKKVALACSVCGSRNYMVVKPNRLERLEVMKFCKFHGLYTMHRETM